MIKIKRQLVRTDERAFFAKRPLLTELRAKPNAGYAE